MRVYDTLKIDRKDDPSHDSNIGIAALSAHDLLKIFSTRQKCSNFTCTIYTNQIWPIQMLRPLHVSGRVTGARGGVLIVNDSHFLRPSVVNHVIRYSLHISLLSASSLRFTADDVRLLLYACAHVHCYTLWHICAVFTFSMYSRSLSPQ